MIWGSRLGSAARRATRTASCASAWRRCVDGEYQDFKSKTAPIVREHFFGKYPELQAMVADMSRRRHLAPEPRRPRSAQGLRRLRGGGEAQGPADRHPRQDRQGLRHGRGGRGPEHHPPAEEDGRDAPARSSATASALPITDEQLEDAAVPHVSPDDSPEMKYLRERREALGRLPAAAAAQGATPLDGAAARRRSTAQLKGTGEAARSRPRWRSCASSTRCCATRRSASAWCRSCPTSRAPSAWRACSASSASSARWASSTGRRTPTS